MTIAGIAHAVFNTPDIERSAEYYISVMGLSETAREADAVYLGCREDNYSIKLQAGEARCTTVAFQAEPGADLGDLAKKAEAGGYVVSRKSHNSPGVTDLLVIEGPEEITVEVAAAAPPANPRGPSGRGIQPNRLGHVAFNVLEPRKAVDFFVKILGFRESDWMGDFFAFLRCNKDHHTINLLRGHSQKMHHIAFETSGWDQIKESSDILSELGYPLIWGPGRHGIGHNIFTYHLTPDGQIMELYAELDQMLDEKLGYFDPRPWHKDRPQRPKVWQPGIDASNQWGIPTPDRFRE